MPFVLLGAEAVELAGAGVEAAEAIGVGAAATEATVATAEAITAAQQADRLAKVLKLVAALAAVTAKTCDNCCARTIVISHSQAPESAKHIDDAQAAGFPRELTYDADPVAKELRRRSSLQGIPTKSGYERDEYPPAAFVENAGAADVRYVTTRDNRSAGGTIGANLKGVPAGCHITLETGP